MVSKTIKNLLDTRQVIEFYGYKPNRKGFINCPFHNGDNTASLKAYSGNKGWNCYGCGRNGSVIDFVMKVFNLTLQQAITRLNYDFKLGLTSEKPSLRQMKEVERRRREQKKYQDCMKLIAEYKDLDVRRYYRQFHNNKPRTLFEELSDEFIEAMIMLNKYEEQ